MKPILLAPALLAVAVATIAAAQVQPIVIYNPSQSVPSGFYLRTNRPLQPGAFVTVASVDVALEYATQRGYADRNDRFLKRIAAADGQVVCAYGDAVSIDGAQVATRIEHDTEGRALPTWRGCRTLAADEIFLLGDTVDSFDGRYWGPVSIDLIEGVWAPVSHADHH